MKRVIVVGATSGIGEALARELANRDCLVGITGRRESNLEALRDDSPQHFTVKSFDCTTSNNGEKLSELVQELGGLDLLILCSGRGNKNSDLEWDIEDRTNRLNVLAFTDIAVWSYRLFERQGYGHFVNISSVAGLIGNRFAPSYSASKAYQINYMQGLSHKAYRSKKPIYITDIRPGYVDTAMGQGDGVFWVAPTDKTAKQILHHIDRKRRVAYVTKRWNLIAAILGVIPFWLFKRA